jgi:hypothetical protein
MFPLLHLAVLITGAWAFLALVRLLVQVRAYGRPQYFTLPAGRSLIGVGYVFGPGMSPAAKESARLHLPTYLGGVGYHLGILAGLTYLALTIVSRAPGGIILRVLQVLIGLGAVCGAALLAKRLFKQQLRALSCPDDYLANLFTTAMLALAFGTTLSPLLRPAFLVEAGVLFLYLPLGKIKHCFFFFTTRFYMGSHFGRRGTFPPRA